jgi:tRNA threonylcarbamoyladenosine biosynthesis protein TsaB
MPLILHIETATPVCSVALSQDGELLAIKESTAKNAHASAITLFIQEVLQASGKELSTLDAVAVSMGPGSYTGLRIGVATAKGLCYALGKPLIAVGTLRAMAEGMRDAGYGMQPPPLEGRGLEVRLCPMIDARRMEVYYALYDKDCNEILSPRAEVITEDSFAYHLLHNTIFFSGDGAGKCREILSHNENAVFIDEFNASAKYMIPLAEKSFLERKFEDLAYFEPFYLKDFLPGKPKVKGLR